MNRGESAVFFPTTEQVRVEKHSPLEHLLVAVSSFPPSHGASAGITLSSKMYSDLIYPVNLQQPARSLRLVCLPTEPQRTHVQVVLYSRSLRKLFIFSSPSAFPLSAVHKFPRSLSGSVALFESCISHSPRDLSFPQCLECSSSSKAPSSPSDS